MYVEEKVRVKECISVNLILWIEEGVPNRRGVGFSTANSDTSQRVTANANKSITLEPPLKRLPQIILKRADCIL